MMGWGPTMLPPDSRSILSESLRPPPGARLDHAVALTFTLDLESALVVPLAFAAHEVRELNDPLTMMESIRACADRVDIFCQAGAVKVPTVAPDLFAFLEPMIHPVRRPRPGRLFHPKLWALRYVDEASGTYPARLLVLSRNLTADRSWDSCLRLDGFVARSPSASNKPIADLLRHAVSLAIDLPASRREPIEGLIEDFRRVEWEAPDGVTEIAFHAVGLGGAPRPDFSGGRHLIVSPFVNEAGLGLVTDGQAATVVGRQEELDRLPEAALVGYEVMVVNELAGLPTDDAEPGRGILTGLHAKLFVVESGRQARWFVGSANATDAAFGGNSELLVELSGGRSTLGLETMIGPDSPFRLILEPYVRQPVVERDHEQWLLENYLRDVAAVPLTITVSPAAEAYEISLTSSSTLPARDGVRLTAELITRLGEGVALNPGERAEASFGPVAMVDITPFLTLKVWDAAGGSASTVVRCRLVNDPAGRLDEVLARQVDTPEKFLRFLALLLGLGIDPIPAVGQGSGGDGAWAVSAPGVLELLMRGLVDQPRQLDDLARLVERLESTERGRQLLPHGFAELWAVVDTVRRELSEVGS